MEKTISKYLNDYKGGKTFLSSDELAKVIVDEIKAKLPKDKQVSESIIKRLGSNENMIEDSYVTIDVRRGIIHGW